LISGKCKTWFGDPSYGTIDSSGFKKIYLLKRDMPDAPNSREKMSKMRCAGIFRQCQWLKPLLLVVALNSRFGF